MNSPSEDIKDMLVADSGLNLIFDYTDVSRNLFIGREPTLPKNCVTIFDTGVFPQDLSLIDQGYERQSIQVRVRNTDYTSGWNMVQDIKDSLHGRNHETWDGTLYTVIACSSGPAFLDWDDNGNVRFVVSFNLQRRVA
jgi:hypothetical protein